MRFLAATLGGWTAIRVALLWPAIDSLPSLVRALAPPVAAATRTPDQASAPTRPRPPARVPGAPRPAGASPDIVQAPVPIASPPRSTPPGDAAPIDLTPREPPPLRPAALATPPNRLAASAWLIARRGREEALATGQLGASQAGVRLTYTLGHRIALAARLSAPLAGRGAEAAFGIDWQPTRAPLHVVAEQRLALDGGEGSPALFVVGGVDPTPLGLGFSLDAYGQAGGILRRSRVIGFADGAARIARPVARIGKARIELGGGAWGGVQPGAARVDLGPSAALIVPIAGRATRLTLDWRQRVAGHARPGSGPALSIGSDF